VLDGALGSRGAALHQSYSDDLKNNGLLLLTKEEFETKAHAFAERGFQVAVHAIGDKANTLVIDVLGKLDLEFPNLRHRIEHVQVLQESDVKRLAQFHLIASFQPTHATSDMPWAEERLGKERIRFSYAWKSVADTGAVLALGSDFPVEDANPLWGIYAARTRKDHAGLPEMGWRSEESLSGAEALKGFTWGGAYASFAENQRGQLKAGFDADFVVLPVDVVNGEPKQLLENPVQVTVVGGIDVYRKQ
jgi:predicted amidohydrolase YtcJ